MAQKSIFIPYFTLDFMIARIADSLFLAQLSLASGECELHSQASGLQKPHYGARMQGEPAGGGSCAKHWRPRLSILARASARAKVAQLSLASGECELHSQASGLQKHPDVKHVFPYTIQSI
jgi:hypothetical protein